MKLGSFALPVRTHCGFLPAGKISAVRTKKSTFMEYRPQDATAEEKQSSEAQVAH